MRRVQADDDAQAFAQLMERWQGPIQGLCTRMVGDAHRGEDLAQDVFTRLYSKHFIISYAHSCITSSCASGTYCICE